MFSLRNLFVQQRSTIQPFNRLCSAFFGTIKPFKLPDLGEKIKEATVKKVYVKEGDTVEEFQTIADVATDKMFTQIPSPFAGKVHKVFHKEEDTCLVGELFLEIELEDGSIAATEKSTTTTSSASTTKQQDQSNKTCSLQSNSAKSESTSANDHSSNDYVLATPSVRAIAKEHKISLKNIKGTGKDGRIMKSDINDFLSNKTNSSTASKPQQ